MKSYSETMYWRTNRKWYKANYDTGKFELTAAAPPRAIKSFHSYRRRNWIMSFFKRKKANHYGNGT